MTLLPVGRVNPAGVLIDTTSIISAQDYIVAQNRGCEPRDPFARDSYSEIVQTLTYNSNIFIAHPTKLKPSPADFGSDPALLAELMTLGIVKPLQLQIGIDRQLDEVISRTLETEGVPILLSYIDATLSIDADTGISFAAKLQEWTEFQRTHVQTPGSHFHRVPQPENDRTGEWVLSVGRAARGQLAKIAADGEETNLLGQLVRGLRYAGDAQAAGVVYQSHLSRRDFVASCIVRGKNDVSGDSATQVIGAIRGVNETMIRNASGNSRERLKLFVTELPMLGGRLWHRPELGKQNDREWIREVARRINGYRIDAAPLREAIESCATSEDVTRVLRDVEEVQLRLLTKFGYAANAPTPVEMDLANTIDTIASAGGLPKMAQMMLSLQTAIGIGDRGLRPHQQFLYRQFRDAWKRSKS